MLHILFVQKVLGKEYVHQCTFMIAKRESIHLPVVRKLKINIL